MAYNILFKRPKFSPSTGSLVATGWSFTPSNNIEYNHVLGEPYQEVLDVPTIIKNYSEYALDVIVRASFSTSAQLTGKVDLLGEIISETHPSVQTGYLLTEDNLAVTNSFSFSGLNQLQEGRYFIRCVFEVFIKIPNAFGTSIALVDRSSLQVNVNVSKTEFIVLSPKALYFSFLKTDLLPEAEYITIQAVGAWYMKTDKKFTASGPGLVDNSTETETIVSGIGNSTIAIGITAEFRNLKRVVYDDFWAEFYSGSDYLGYVTLGVALLSDQNFVIKPTFLDFIAVKTISEAPPQSFQVYGFGNYTLSGPNWLVLSKTTGRRADTFEVTVTDSGNLTAGTYTGNITIENNVTVYELPITYEVQGSISTPLKENVFNFTKDLHYLNVKNHKHIDGGVVSLTLTATVFDFLTQEESVYVFPYTLPFFQDVAKLHIGEIVHRFFVKANKLSQFRYEQLHDSTPTLKALFNPASVSLDVEIISRNTAVVDYEETFSNILFVPGVTPPSFKNNAGILNNSTYTKRVTKTSRELFSFLVPSSSFSIAISVNNAEHEILGSYSTTGNNIFRYAFDFSKYDAGDSITMKLLVNDQVYSKSYQLIPEGPQSYHIAFVNQYNVLELFECTGEIAINSDIAKITHTYFRNLVEVIESMGSTKKMSLIINTGHIYKEDVLIIDDMLRGKIAWLIFEDKPAIELVAKDKKMTNYDSRQELYEYDIEFNINRKHDAENYIF